MFEYELLYFGCHQLSYDVRRERESNSWQCNISCKLNAPLMEELWWGKVAPTHAQNYVVDVNFAFSCHKSFLSKPKFSSKECGVVSSSSSVGFRERLIGRNQGNKPTLTFYASGYCIVYWISDQATITTFLVRVYWIPAQIQRKVELLYFCYFTHLWSYSFFFSDSGFRC